MENRLVSRVLDFYITTHCSLNCKLCMTDIPQIRDKHHIPVDSLVKQLEAFFHVWDYAARLEYMGGEPLMHPDMYDIIKETLRFRDQFRDLRIATNGTIIPNDQVLELIASCGKFFDFVVDDYGPLSKNIKEVTERLEYYKIPYRIDVYTGENQHFNGWVKLGDYAYIDYEEAVLREQYRECVQVKDEFAIVYEGKVFQCPYPLRFFILKNILPERDEYVDLFDDTLSREEKREIAAGFYKTPTKACHCCFGFSEKKSRRYPAAEQVPRIGA
ncbi:MAG: radical SAM protein [Acidaminococcaceae bacterium]|nr:radical SAM protein [Acidaminococcaceae bacterium]